MDRVRRALTLGLVTGIVGLSLSTLPVVGSLEDSTGLRLLFQIRGPIEPPPGVTVVSIDEASSSRMGLPDRPRDWPRSTHATLVDRLHARGVSTIVFDVEFFRHSPSAAEDAALAAAIERSGRVVLVQRLDRLIHEAGDMWEWQDPIPSLAEAAAALAPAVLPAAPLVSGAWSFVSTPRGEIPALAPAALQLHFQEHTGRLLGRLEAAGVEGATRLAVSTPGIPPARHLLQTMQAIRTAVLAHAPEVDRLAEQIESEDAGDDILPLLRLYSGAPRGYLNFYGPPGTICTVPYDDIFNEADQSACALQGAVVLVGIGRARVERADREDTHYTLYSGESGPPFSGVEIHATALGNLLDGSRLTELPPGAAAAGLMATGTLFGSLAYWVRTRRRRSRGAVTARVQAAAAAAALLAIYIGIAYIAFDRHQTLMPLVVPALFQFPLALVCGMVAKPVAHREAVHGVCLVTDAAGSTAVGQRLSHSEYARLMSGYTDALLKPVLLHGGEPLAPQGDGFVCLWPDPAAGSSAGGTSTSCRLEACLAALEITRASSEFNAALPGERRLPTRIGVTAGPFTIHSDADRGVYEAFGDALNLGARLRDLNVELGTSVLASEDVVKDLGEVLDLKPMPGLFVMKGISAPPPVVEITGRRPSPSVPRPGSSPVM